MRIAGSSKCASDPRVVCALRYGCKSGASRQLAPLVEALGLAHRAPRRPDRLRPSTRTPEDAAPPPVASGGHVNRQRPGL